MSFVSSQLGSSLKGYIVVFERFGLFSFREHVWTRLSLSARRICYNRGRSSCAKLFPSTWSLNLTHILLNHQENHYPAQVTKHPEVWSMYSGMTSFSNEFAWECAVWVIMWRFTGMFCTKNMFGSDPDTIIRSFSFGHMLVYLYHYAKFTWLFIKATTRSGSGYYSKDGLVFFYFFQEKSRSCNSLSREAKRRANKPFFRYNKYGLIFYNMNYFQSVYHWFAHLYSYMVDELKLCQ